MDCNVHARTCSKHSIFASATFKSFTLPNVIQQTLVAIHHMSAGLLRKERLKHRPGLVGMGLGHGGLDGMGLVGVGR